MPRDEPASLPPMLSNWSAKLANKPELAVSEYAVFSDARIDGDLQIDSSPYAFINAQAWSPRSNEVRAVLTLRMSEHTPGVRPDFTRTDSTLHHGGNLRDELTALLSLVTGTRMMAGGRTRLFGGADGPFGRPIHDDCPTPVVLGRKEVAVLPNAKQTVRLASSELLNGFIRLGAADAISLIRSARQYQEALWMAEAQPALSWLLLVSAVETAANRWRAFEESPTDRIVASMPDLVDFIKASGGNDFMVAGIAERISHTLGATKKFIDFVLEFHPGAPETRPLPEAQINWDRPHLKRHLSKIYGYRSNALHGGIPFPGPMCLFASKSGTGYQESGTVGLASHTQGGVWLREDVPMNLHAFEHLARGSILNWWSHTLAQN